MLITQKGFSLIELLVSVAIIGMLAAIAIPELGVYRDRVYDAVALSDLKNAIAAQQSYYIDHEDYYSGSTVSGLTNFGFQPSAGIYFSTGSKIGNSLEDLGFAIITYNDRDEDVSRQGPHAFCYDSTGEQADLIQKRYNRGNSGLDTLGDCW